MVGNLTRTSQLTCVVPNNLDGRHTSLRGKHVDLALNLLTREGGVDAWILSAVVAGTISTNDPKVPQLDTRALKIVKSGLSQLKRRNDDPAQGPDR
jgi:hypothetical protein